MKKLIFILLIVCEPLLFCMEHQSTREKLSAMRRKVAATLERTDADMRDAQQSGQEDRAERKRTAQHFADLRTNDSISVRPPVDEEAEEVVVRAPVNSADSSEWYKKTVYVSKYILLPFVAGAAAGAGIIGIGKWFTRK